MSATTLIFVFILYLGALGVFWVISLKYKDGTSFQGIVPYGIFAIMMLFTASALYYDFTDAPLYRATVFVWIATGLWIIGSWISHKRSQ